MNPELQQAKELLKESLEGQTTEENIIAIKQFLNK